MYTFIQHTQIHAYICRNMPQTSQFAHLVGNLGVWGAVWSSPRANSRRLLLPLRKVVALGAQFGSLQCV